MGAGNLPALFRPGPRIFGICLISVSEAMNALYFLASFLTSFLSLFSFLSMSASMQGRTLALAWSQGTWSPRIHTFILGFGTCGSLTVPAKRLSFWGSWFFRAIWSSTDSVNLLFLAWEPFSKAVIASWSVSREILLMIAAWANGKAPC